MRRYYIGYRRLLKTIFLGSTIWIFPLKTQNIIFVQALYFSIMLVKYGKTRHNAKKCPQKIVNESIVNSGVSEGRARALLIFGEVMWLRTLESRASDFRHATWLLDLRCVQDITVIGQHSTHVRVRSAGKGYDLWLILKESHYSTT